MLACALSYPLILNLGTHVPGLPGDDLATPLVADGIRYVVSDRDAINTVTRVELERRGLRFVMEEGPRELYRVGR